MSVNVHKNNIKKFTSLYKIIIDVLHVIFNFIEDGSRNL